MDLESFLRHYDISAPRHEHPAVMTCDEADRLVPPLPGTTVVAAVAERTGA